MLVYAENEAVLGNFEERGVDLSRPILVDFSHLFSDRTSADQFAMEAERFGFTITVNCAEAWDVTASKIMLPTCSNVTAAELQLGELARARGGKADGWGFLTD